MACVVIVLLLMTGNIPFVRAPHIVPLANACGDSVHYAAYDAARGSNTFGPKQDFADVDAATKRLDMKMCQDPLFASTIVSFAKDGVHLDPAQAEATAKAYVGNRQQWSKAVTSLKAKVASYTVENIDAPYESLAMLPKSSKAEMPKLLKVDRPVVLGKVLVLHLKDGSERMLRIICDLQPSAPHFPKVAPVVPPTKSTPPAPAPRKTQPPTTPKSPTPCVCPTTSKSPSPTPSHCVCPTTKPSPSPSDCHCVTPTEVTQPKIDTAAPVPQFTAPPQSPGASVGPRPSPNPTSDPVSSPTPAPSGYNGGTGPTSSPEPAVTPSSPEPASSGDPGTGGF